MSIKRPVPHSWPVNVLFALFFASLSLSSCSEQPRQGQSSSASPSPRIEFIWQTKHGNTVNSVAFSPDGKTIVSGSDDGTVALLDADKGKLNRTLTHNNVVNSVAFSLDGGLIASGSSDKTVKIWDPHTAEVKRILTHDDVVTAIAFSPDGKTLASGNDIDETVVETVKLWDVDTGKQKRSLVEDDLSRVRHSSVVNSIAFSPDGKLLARAFTQNWITLWEAQTGRLGQRLVRHGATVNSLRFSRDSKMIASGGKDSSVILWDAQTGEVKRVLRPRRAHWVTSVAFSPDSKTVMSGGRDKTIKFYDVGTGELKMTLTSNNAVTSIAVSPDGQALVSGDEDGMVTLWNARIETRLATLTGSKSPEVTEGFWESGRQWIQAHRTFAIVATLILLWLISEAIVRRRRSSNAKVKSQERDASPHNLKQTFDKAREIQKLIRKLLSETSYVTPEIVLRGHDKAVYSVIFSPDSKVIATAGDDGKVILWDVATKEKKSVLDHGRGVLALAFSRDGKVIASGSIDGLVIVWNAITGEEIQPFDTQTERILEKGARKTWLQDDDIHRWNNVTSLAFSSDGKTIASCVNGGTVKLWDLQTIKAKKTLATKTPLFTVAFSPEGRYLVSGGHEISSREDDIALILWEVQTGEEKCSLNVRNAGGVFSAAFSPDGRVLALGNDNDYGSDQANDDNDGDASVRLYSLQNGTLTQKMTLNGHSQPVRSIAFSPNGEVIASGSADCTVTLWGVQGVKWQQTLKHDDTITSVTFSPDGSRLACASVNKTVKVWRVQSKT